MRSAVVGGVALLATAAVPALGVETTTPIPERAWSTKDTITLTVAGIGAVTGVLGAVLGIINTWNSISARRARLRI